MPSVVVKQLSLLVHIQEVLASILGQERWDSTLK